jgi:hypothetical protein
MKKCIVWEKIPRSAFRFCIPRTRCLSERRSTRCYAPFRFIHACIISCHLVFGLDSVRDRKPIQYTRYIRLPDNQQNLPKISVSQRSPHIHHSSSLCHLSPPPHLHYPQPSFIILNGGNTPVRHTNTSPWWHHDRRLGTLITNHNSTG